MGAVALSALNEADVFVGLLPHDAKTVVEQLGQWYYKDFLWVITTRYKVLTTKNDFVVDSWKSRKSDRPSNLSNLSELNAASFMGAIIGNWR